MNVSILSKNWLVFYFEESECKISICLSLLPSFCRGKCCSQSCWYLRGRWPRCVTWAKTDIRLMGQFRLEGNLEVSGPTSCLKQGQLSSQTRSLRALSILVLKISQDGDRASSLGSLLRCLMVLMGKCFSLNDLHKPTGRMICLLTRR